MRFLIVLSLMGACFAGELFEIKPLHQCDNLSSIKHVYVENCVDSSLCKLARGTNTTIKIVMTAPKSVQIVKALVTGDVGGAELPFPGFNRNICQEEYNKDFCPQEAGKDYTLILKLPILSIFPKIKTIASVRLIDDEARSVADEKLACFKIRIELVDNPNAKVQAKPTDDDDDEE